VGSVVRFSVNVKPSSSNNRLLLEPDGGFQLRVKAPPTKGRANREIVRWLSKSLNVPSSAINIVRGEHSKEKIIEISGVEMGQVLKLAERQG